MASNPPELYHLPRATYRLQLSAQLGFERVQSLLEYLSDLGISDVYLSPLFRFREESTHGYDVVDHNAIEPTFGSRDEFTKLASRCSELGMGILLDVVPNHMGINDPANELWNDVLENGPAAQSATYFDIDWNAPSGEMHNRVLLPFLGEPFGQTLESGQLRLGYENHRLSVVYFDRRFPLAPPTWVGFLECVLQVCESAPTPVCTELASIISQLRNLPRGDGDDAQASQERYREQSVARRRLARLVSESAEVARGMQTALDQFNGTPGDARSWDPLEGLLNQQHFRLAYWRVATDETNYRRFFDINELAAIRVEREEVFEHVHRLVGELLQAGHVSGLRIDHPDGLLDPLEYFQRLQNLSRRSQGEERAQAGRLYIVAEKILSGNEELPSAWPISGTTGYDLLNRIAGVLVDPAGVRQLKEEYARFTGNHQTAADIAYHSKLTVLHQSMASELYVAASQLYHLAKASRASCDFTLPMLHRGLREVIACFPVYRTYKLPGR